MSAPAVPALPSPAPNAVVDFATDPAFHHLFYRDPTAGEVAAFSDWLRAHRDVQVRLYHGTGARVPALEQGLLPTSARRRRSLQSSAGYVYLSVYPDMAASFGQMGYPGQAVAVYAVEVPLAWCLADRDQLRNQRHFAGRTTGDTLAESLVWGHAVRVRGLVPATHLRRHPPLHRRAARSTRAR